MIILHLTITDGPFNDLAESMIHKFLTDLDDFSMGVNGKMTSLDTDGNQLRAQNIINGEFFDGSLTNGPEQLQS